MMDQIQRTSFTQVVHIGSPTAPAQEIEWRLTEGTFGQGIFRLPEKLGYGRMSMSAVGPTIAYVLLELCLDRDIAVERPNLGEQRSVTYCRKGGMWMLGENGQKKEQRAGSLLYCDKPKGKKNLFLFRAGEQTEWSMFLLHSVGEMLPLYHYPILQVFEQAQEKGVKFPCITRSPEIARVFELDRPSEETDPTVRRVMLSSKLVSISAILLDKGMGQMQESVRGISAEEREMLEEARSILLQDFNHPPTISQIAHSVGLNETKLKRDFKQFYGLPIYQYLKKAKMDRAMELLTGTDLSIREIAFRCGYDSQSQFTAAFRTAYHLAPNDAHKKFRRFL